jgi:CubicO group peptidase (beta-lactamase class C family)
VVAAFLRQNIFGPLGMTRTGTDTTAIRTGHALGYYADGSQPAAAQPAGRTFHCPGKMPPDW